MVALPGAMRVQGQARFRPSGDLVSREIGGEIIIVPLASGQADLEKELFTLNQTGRAVWAKLDGSRSVDQVVRELALEFDAPEETIRADVIDLVSDLVECKLLVEA
jgi:hypothetical protein